jgi:hypothetical protein
VVQKLHLGFFEPLRHKTKMHEGKINENYKQRSGSIANKRFSTQEKTQLMKIFAKFGWWKRFAEVKLICHA